MKKLLLLYFITIISFNCNKEKSPNNTEIEGVTGIQWQLFYLRKSTDTYIHPNPTNWYFNLNSNGSFTCNLNNSVSRGTYSWTQIDSSKAKVNFTIQNWSSAIADTQYTNRLKDILQTVDSCRYLKYPNYSLPFPMPFSPGSTQLQFYGNDGEFFYAF